VIPSAWIADTLTGQHDRLQEIFRLATAQEAVS
jgi:hypothetical protein